MDMPDELIDRILMPLSMLERFRAIGTCSRFDARLVPALLSFDCPSLGGRRITNGGLALLLRGGNIALTVGGPVCANITMATVIAAAKAARLVQLRAAYTVQSLWYKRLNPCITMQAAEEVAAAMPSMGVEIRRAHV